MADTDKATPLFVRLPSVEHDRLEQAVADSGKTKRQIVTDAVREHLTVGRIDFRRPEHEVLTAAEAAALLQVDDAAVVAAAEAGDLPGRRLGGEWRFSRAAVLAWLAGGD